MLRLPQIIRVQYAGPHKILIINQVPHYRHERDLHTELR